jgi:NADH-quinone oxidoreductase subunit N
VCNAFAFGILLYSLAGIPPLSGFYSKLGILVSLLSKTHIVISTVVVIFSSIACFYYIKLVKIFSFVPTSKDLFWFDGGTKNVESFIGFALFVVGTCLFRPDSLLEMSIGVATIVV